MPEMIAYCGLDCGTCNALIATQRNDNELRKKVAEEWSKAFGHPMKPEDINCTGCTTPQGVHIGYCESMCEVRKCAKPRQVATCADCSDYACAKLEGFFKMAPQAKTKLEGLRKAKKR